MKHVLVIAAIFREMAPNLDARAVQARNADLRQETCAVLSRYFKTEAAPEGAALRSGESVA